MPKCKPISDGRPGDIIYMTPSPYQPPPQLFLSQQANITPHGPQMGIYMGPIWATHKGLMRDLQHGSMLDPHGQSHMELYGFSMGKSTHIYLPEKNKTFRHFYTKIISPQSQPI